MTRFLIIMEQNIEQITQPTVQDDTILPDHNPTVLKVLDSENDFIANRTFREKLATIKETAKDDFRKASWKGKVALSGLITNAAYEWGPVGNETTAPILFGQFSKSSSGLSGVALTSLATASFVGIQQWAAGRVAIYSSENFPNTTEKTLAIANHENSDDLDQEDRFKPFEQLSRTRQGIYSFSFGTSFNVTREAFLTSSGLNKDTLLAVNRKSSAITAGLVGAVALLVDGADNAMPEVESVQFLTDKIISNPLTWIGLSMGILAKDAVIRRFKSRKSQQ